MHGHFHARHIESYNCAVETLCRDCGDRPPSDAEPCPACGSVRIVRHKELHGLTIAHLDCDAFYAAIEKRDRPELRDIPVVVGGHYRGVVAACCYVARAQGVHSAMPMFKALKACPDATVIKPDMKKYAGGFGHHFLRFDTSSVVPSRSSSCLSPDPIIARSFPSALTTTAFDRSRRRWFETRSCKPVPRGPPSSVE